MIRKIKLSVKELNEQLNLAYLKGYDVGKEVGERQGLFKKYTPNDIRACFGCPPLSENEKYWSNICVMQKAQTEKGKKTYGQILEENTSMNMIERLEYLEEELIDALMYIEHIKALEEGE